MKIVGGNFGVSGSASVSNNDTLVIKGANKVTYRADQVASVSARVVKERKFGVAGFIIGLLLFSVLLGLLLNVIGVIIAIVLAVAGSFYSKKRNIAEVRFNDDQVVVLECSGREIKRLYLLYRA